MPPRCLFTVNGFKSRYKYNAHVTFVSSVSCVFKFRIMSPPFFFHAINLLKNPAFIKRDVKIQRRAIDTGSVVRNLKKCQNDSPVFQDGQGADAAMVQRKVSTPLGLIKTSQEQETGLKNARFKVPNRFNLSKTKVKPSRKGPSNPQ